MTRTRMSFCDWVTSPFRHNFTTTALILILIAITLISVLHSRIFPFTEREALNLLVFMGIFGLLLKSYQLFKSYPLHEKFK